jgi:hypothetical protein
MCLRMTDLQRAMVEASTECTRRKAAGREAAAIAKAARKASRGSMKRSDSKG